MDEDFYALLGVDRNATDDQIKKAYRKQARELHPDANPGDAAAEEKFKKVSLAYEVLRDPEKRQRYDQYGVDGLRGGGGGGFGGGQGFDGMGLGDIFEAFFGGGGSPFGGGGRRRSGPPPGRDVEVTAVVDFETALFGGTHDVTVRLPVPCDTCEGTGAKPGTQPHTCSQCQGAGEIRQVRQSLLGQVVTAAACPKCSGTGQEVDSPCPRCHGEGARTEERTYPVEIPSGIDNGQTLRLTGRGGAGPRGGPAGDLYVHVEVTPSDKFERHGGDLIHRLHIPMTQAALGAHISLETFDGTEEVVIDPGTAAGKLFRFRGKGVPSLNGRSRGDLIVQLFVDTPTKLSHEEQELLEKFAALRGEEVGVPGFMDKLKGAFK